MNETLIIIVLITSIIGLLAGGVWVGLALSGAAWFVMEVFSPRSAGDAMAISIWELPQVGP